MGYLRDPRNSRLRWWHKTGREPGDRRLYVFVIATIFFMVATVLEGGHPAYAARYDNYDDDWGGSGASLMKISEPDELM